MQLKKNENIIKKAKPKNRKDELDLISSIYMPDSVVMTSLDKNQL